MSLVCLLLNGTHIAHHYRWSCSIRIYDITFRAMILPSDSSTIICTYVFSLGSVIIYWNPWHNISICVSKLGYVSIHWDLWHCIRQCDKDSTSSHVPPRSFMGVHLSFWRHSLTRVGSWDNNTHGATHVRWLDLAGVVYSCFGPFIVVVELVRSFFREF